MLRCINSKLVVPVQISQFVFKNGLIKPFSVFLYLKLFSGDKVSESDPVFDSLRIDLKMNDCKKRTFRKHLQVLIKLNWIGFNSKSGVYHVRSFDFIRAVNGFKARRSTVLQKKDILIMQTYLVGVLICNEIHNQKYYWEFVKGGSRAATTKRDVANQSKSSFHSSKPNYYGLGNNRIAEILGCKYTRACVLKNEAAEAGYLSNHHRYRDIAVLQKADYNLRPVLYQQNPSFAKRLKYWRQIINGKKVVKLVMQLHDEIKPLIEFKRVAAFSSLKVPFITVKGLFKTNRSAQAA